MITPAWRPIQRLDGYLAIADYGLVGDGVTAALIGSDRSIAWLCLPRFDAAPVFCGLLDAEKGGGFTVRPESLREARQFYEPDSAVLVTEMRSATGSLRITDPCPLVSGADLSEDVPATRRELLRSITELEGAVRLCITIEPWGGGEAEPRDGAGCGFTAKTGQI